MRHDLNLIERVSEQLVAMLGDDFDAETFWDTLDGETDAMDVIGHLIRSREEAKAHADASKALAREYTDRARRLDEKQKALASSLGVILDATGQRKVAHPFGTVSRTNGRMSLVIEDEASIPSQLTKTTVAPDKGAIKAQLEAGETVPGARLERGADGLTVRVK
jgi:hypothetical protein